jgi:hypothetical protein
MIQKELGKQFSSELERVAFLKDNCDTVEHRGYMKRFTPEQLIQMKETLSEVSIEINDIEEEKKLAMETFKTQLKPHLEEKAKILKGLKQKAEFVEENCYKFIYQEEKMVGYYNSEGELIEARPIQSDEMQGTIFQMNRDLKTGTND